MDEFAGEHSAQQNQPWAQELARHEKLQLTDFKPINSNQTSQAMKQARNSRCPEPQNDMTCIYLEHLQDNYFRPTC